MQEQSTQSETSQHAGCMIGIFTILAVYQILFAIRVLLDNGVSAEVLQFSPVVQSLIALFWAGLFSLVLWRLWRKRPNAIRFSTWLIICFIISRLLQTSLFAQADYDRHRIGYLIMVTLMILIVPVLLLLKRNETGTYK